MRTMCRVLGVSACGFYAWREHASSQRSIANAVMTERIPQIQQDSYEYYGMPRGATRVQTFLAAKSIPSITG